LKNYTDITILLDRSGSMGAIKKDMEGAFDTFLTEHRRVPSTKMTLIQFSSVNDHQVVYQNVPVEAVEKLNIDALGGTPLLDAFCKAIDSTGTRLANMKESDRADKVLMIVITDGEENQSKTYTRNDVKSRVTKQQTDYKWEFVYLGANQDAFQETQSFGIPWSNVLKYTLDTKHINEGIRSLSASTGSYASGASATAGNFTDAVRINTATLADREKDSTPKEKK
jgi:uncharacterized protein YegL